MAVGGGRHLDPAVGQHRLARDHVAADVLPQAHRRQRAHEDQPPDRGMAEHLAQPVAMRQHVAARKHEKQKREIDKAGAGIVGHEAKLGGGAAPVTAR